MATTQQKGSQMQTSFFTAPFVFSAVDGAAKRAVGFAHVRPKDFGTGFSQGLPYAQPQTLFPPSEPTTFNPCGLREKEIERARLFLRR
jgi:hypothetical protein